VRRAERGCCVICGRQAVEEHHVVGRHHHSTLTAPLCQACHALATENLRKADVDMRHTSDSAERLRRALKAAAVFLQMLARALWNWAESVPDSERTRGP
jgi:hypothetical protein